MNTYSGTWKGIERPSAKIGPRRDITLFVNDLMPLLDIACLIAAGYASVVLYTLMLVQSSSAERLWSDYGTRAVAAALIAPFILGRRWSPRGVGSRSAQTQFRLFSVRFMNYISVALGIGVATRSMDNLPRMMVVLWIAVGFMLTLCSRFMVGSYLYRLQRTGVLRQTVAVVGAGPVADRLIRHLLQNEPASIHIVGVFDDWGGAAKEKCTFGPTGSIANLVEQGQQRQIDWVLVTLPCTAENQLLKLVHTLKSLAVTVGLCPQNIGLSMPCGSIDYVGDGLPVTILADRPIKQWNAVIKAAEDGLLGGLIALLLLPLMALVAVAIKLDSPGPILFRQRRHTSNNIEFDVYKFRTMSWRPAEDNGVLRQTDRNDDRITRLGRILRKSSLDELPQVFNVLRGEMSLVGPRPHAVNMRTEQRLGHEIIDTYPHRHRVKPGITGWSQVNGSRGATETAEELKRRVELDLHYVENWTLWLDLKILVMTFWVVLRGTNAR